MKTYLYVTPFFPSTNEWWGSYSLNFIRALQNEVKGSLRVVVLKPGSGCDYQMCGVTVHRFQTRQLPSSVLPFLFADNNCKSFQAALVRAGVAIEEVVVCHANTAGCAIYPVWLKAKNPSCLTLLHHHDLQSFGLNLGRLRHCWIYNMIQFPILRKLHEKIDTHVFISEAAKRSFLAAPDTSWTSYAGYVRQMRGLPYRSVRISDSIILHNGVDKSVFNADGACVKDSGLFVIGCVGNFTDLKDQTTLFRAVKILRPKLPNLRVRCVGTEILRPTCEEFVRKNGLDDIITFQDELSPKKLAEFYRSLDLFVLPSYFEGFGCVYTEAHACGVPFIACEGQGIEDVVEPEEKRLWLCRQRDPEDLAEKILKYYTRRPKQHLTEDQDIQILVRRFVSQLKERING